MELTGKLIKTLGSVTGQGKNGAWKKQEFMIETGGQYPKKIAFQVFNDKCQIPRPGSEITVSFDPESREHEGRFYTQLTAWKIVPISGGYAQPQNDPYATPLDDLPF